MTRRCLEAVLVWPGGRRQPMANCQGALYWIVPEMDQESGRILEHTFEMANRHFAEGEPLEYLHSKTEDVTARCRESRERAENRRWQERGIRRPVMAMELQGRYHGETDEEHARRVAIIESGETDR